MDLFQKNEPRQVEFMGNACQASKTAFRSRCARPGGTLHERGVPSEYPAAREVRCVTHFRNSRRTSPVNFAAANSAEPLVMVAAREGKGSGQNKNFYRIFFRIFPLM